MNTETINWRQNCLTGGPHDGRPDAIWNIPLNYAIGLFSAETLESLVIARIVNDAMEFVEASPFIQKETGASFHYTEEWADEIRKAAQVRYRTRLQHTVGAIATYYKSDSFTHDSMDAAERLKDNKLNPAYEPLHPYDSLNMLCRILAKSVEVDVEPGK